MKKKKKTARALDTQATFCAIEIKAIAREVQNSPKASLCLRPLHLQAQHPACLVGDTGVDLPPQ